MQGAIALEALVSAAFILIGGKTGDLIGRKLAYILGLLGYAVGAIAMTLAQDLTAIIVFWAIIGGIGASLLLPSMQSLIHGNFEGAHQKRVYALVGASAAIAAAVGPLIGGFITTFLSWRVGFALEAVIIAIVLSGIGLVKDVPYTGYRVDRLGRRGAVGRRHGRHRARHPRLAGGRRLRRPAHRHRRARARLARLVAAQPQAPGKPTLIDPALFESKVFRAGVSGQLLQQVALGGTMIVLPLYLQMVLEYNALQAGLSIAPLSLSMFVVALLAGAGSKRRPGEHHPVGLRARSWWARDPRADRAARRLGLVAHDPAHHRGLRPRPAGLAAEQLHALADLRRARERGGGRELRGRVVRSLVRPRVRRARSCSRRSRSRSPRAPTRAPCSRPSSSSRSRPVLEEDAEIMSNTGLEELLADETPEVQDEIIAHQHRARGHRAAGRPARADPRGAPRHPERAAHAAAARSEGGAGGGGRADDVSRGRGGEPRPASRSLEAAAPESGTGSATCSRSRHAIEFGRGIEGW